MSAAQHTPGPWAHHPSVHGSEYRYVQIGDDENYTTLEMKPADAILASASPDLLEALQGLMDDPEGQFAWKKATAAIAKATGHGA